MPESKKSGLSENSLGAIAYITVVPALFFLAVAPYNKNANVRFHAWQSTALFVVTFVLCLVLSFFPMLNTYHMSLLVYLGIYILVWLLWILASIWCAFTALNGKRTKIPVIGAWAEQKSKQ